jgi:hypothetical protein
VVHASRVGSITFAATWRLHGALGGLRVRVARVVVDAARLVFAAAITVAAESSLALPIGSFTGAFHTIGALGQALVDVAVVVGITKVAVVAVRTLAVGEAALEAAILAATVGRTVLLLWEHRTTRPVAILGEGVGVRRLVTGLLDLLGLKSVVVASSATVTKSRE